MIGRKLAHYEIVDKIGEGGMAEVYRARDLKHASSRRRRNDARPAGTGRKARRAR
jgi:serine/threonine protein kinase